MGNSMIDLEFYTTEQLIEEILSRSTFAGIIINSSKQVKNYDELHVEWFLQSQNLNIREIYSILKEIIDQMQPTIE